MRCPSKRNYWLPHDVGEIKGGQTLWQQSAGKAENSGSVVTELSLALGDELFELLVDAGVDAGVRVLG